jgi:LCP family protein required for cell wall assembly
MDKRRKPIIGNRRPKPRRSQELNTRRNKPSPRKTRNQGASSLYNDNGNGSGNHPNRKKRSAKKNGCLARFLKIFVAIGFLYFFYLIIFGNLHSDLKKNAFRLQVSPSAYDFALRHKIVNVAVLGVDEREGVEGSRSDSMMIATADYEHNAIKVTSLLRDTYVYIDEDYGFDKLNAAYSIGGAEKALKVINENFDVAVTDYVVIDFNSMPQMVNAVGGVDIEIKTYDELEWTNEYLWDVNEKVNTHSPNIPDIGLQRLDGNQALAYCRVRYAGHGDYERTQRQRAVFEQVLKKVIKQPPWKQIAFYNTVKPYIDTSLSFNQLMTYGGRMIFHRNARIEQAQIPDSRYLAEDMRGDVSYVFPDTLEDNIKALYRFIYESDYNPSQNAKEISRNIEERW